MYFKKKRGFVLLLLFTMTALSVQGCGASDQKVEETREMIHAMGSGDNSETDQETNTETPNAENAAATEEVSGVEMTDTLRWCSAAYAILTEMNGRDYTTFETVPMTEAMKTMQQQALDEWWGVTDRASADENLEWIMTEGHRVSFKDEMEYLEECGIKEVAADDRKDFISENFEVTDDEAAAYANDYNIYEEYGEHAIDAWDYCRALNLMNFYYVAGYYSAQEAMDKSLEIAQELQPLYSSWDELINSYLRGYEYWAEESSEERRGVYEDLLERSDNPYAIPYDTVLEKTW